MIRKRSALLLAFIPAVSTFSSAMAADTELETVIVNAYRTAESLGASTKTDTPLIETPQSVSVITREELDARGVQNLNDAMRYNAGVIAESGGIDNRVDDVYIRGFDAGSWGDNVTLDGMRAPQGGQWNRAMFDSWNLERVEVLKGPSAVLYGQVAPGGMVNQTSKAPRAGLVPQVRLSADQHGKYQAAFDAGDANWRAVGLYSDGDTQIDHSSSKHWFAAPSVAFGNEQTRLTLRGLYQQDRGGSTFQFLPYEGTVQRTPYGVIDNTAFIGEPNWNVYNRDIWTTGWQLDHGFNENWRLSQGARVTHVDSLYRTTVGGTQTLRAGRYFGRRAVQGEGDSDGYTVDTRIQGKFASGALDHTLLAGLDWQYADWTHLRQLAAVSPTAIEIDVFNPVYLNSNIAPLLAPQISTAETDRQTGIYLQDQIALDAWRFTIGGRYDRAKIHTLDRLSNEHSYVDEGAFTLRTGATYLFSNGSAPYASYAESFQPATGSDRFGAAFEPVTGKQIEAGVKYEPKSIDGLLTLSIYDLRQQNMLTTDPVDDDYQTQTGEVRVRGVELEGRVSPLENFSIIGALTRFGSKITQSNDGDQGNRMTQVPDWTGSLWLDYTFKSGWARGLSLAGGGRYIGATFGDTANALEIPSYTLLDAAIRYDLGRLGATNAQLAVHGSNLADKRYVSTCSSRASCFYGSGRLVTATVRLSW